MDEIVSNIESIDPQQAAPPQETKWYVIRVVSGKERKIKEYIDREVKINNWSKSVVQVLCPIEKVFKVLNGKKVLKEKTLYPGYILLEAVDGKLTDDIIHAVSNVTNVIHFLGRENPTALRKSEVNKMFGKMDEVSEQGIGYAEPYINGETVKIVDGPFNDFNGVVEEVNEEKKKLKVVVKIVGRATPVELNYSQVEKIA
jgi:transcription termination/antitermination protein NusG